ncbi:hypothetical protein [Bacillus sp. Marseille-P3661]|uniref:hypothetical protein n=1 Tax=Bacillus sp. Marseille-P3661 TaxID=1936234 RepID=UPI0015E19A53|nr:hypothetical protein [Bacillus sp. Marseille-P3661]
MKRKVDRKISGKPLHRADERGKVIAKSVENFFIRQMKRKVDRKISAKPLHKADEEES